MRPPNAHYIIPGTGLELIDIIEMKLTREEWQAICRASLMQYVWRWDLKGEPEKDLDKAKVYLDWLIESVNEKP